MNKVHERLSKTGEAAAPHVHHLESLVNNLSRFDIIVAYDRTTSKEL